VTRRDGNLRRARAVNRHRAKFIIVAVPCDRLDSSCLKMVNRLLPACQSRRKTDTLGGLPPIPAAVWSPGNSWVSIGPLAAAAGRIKTISFVLETP